MVSDIIEPEMQIINLVPTGVSSVDEADNIGLVAYWLAGKSGSVLFTCYLRMYNTSVPRCSFLANAAYW